MSFWWVNHKQTFKSELHGGYIWSPRKNRNGSRNETYLNLPRTAPRDIIISYANAKISAIGVITDGCKEQTRPDEFGMIGQAWNDDGWKVSVEWVVLQKPIAPKDHIVAIAPLLPTTNSPIRQNGNGNQGCYLASISADLGNLILNLSQSQNPVLFEFILESSNELLRNREQERIDKQNISQTEKEQIIKSRVGQGTFKLNVYKIENGCRITGVTDPSLLIASHIKPWKDSSNEERLDGNNGLLLSPHVDRLFDRGWISFESDGTILISNLLDSIVLEKWKLERVKSVGSFHAEQLKYLTYHREHVFRKEVSLPFSSQDLDPRNSE